MLPCRTRAGIMAAAAICCMAGTAGCAQGAGMPKGGARPGGSAGLKAGMPAMLGTAGGGPYGL